MGMDFHNDKNRTAYSTRKANKSWTDTIDSLLQINTISKAVDIGCGGGIYAKALSDMGVKSVTGVDFSSAMLEGAKENCKEHRNISFHNGTALETGLKSEKYDLVLERALIHHISDLHQCFTEAYRLLRENGYIVVQDRTPEDCMLQGDQTHIRGYFFELFPRLLTKETARRYTSEQVKETLLQVGFTKVEEVKLWETRQIYETKEQLLQDLRARTGRSILHELDNHELNLLIKYINKALTNDQNIIEKDRWTIWKAGK
ncbi:class I SAM-dependent methyltransferase [Ornithinibacillus salinisoli]|uniref:Class I SAM-dependent methyltransferase n=1 Tax=Ornithinibacillus salinisoli TaxID=1848459 RepID=A0ABW4W1B5_9BACI